ncbi:MAG: hypothetical protein HY259_06980 [Chloroflexi bacterium]|nr:hypothetical protein [Chloroflexota bacterium]MBI3733188.1 hypothetical protein [Chloroflexota bacterium]
MSNFNPLARSQLVLYISAAPELESERHHLSQAVATMPTSLGWQIAQTPQPDQPLNLDALARADLHLLVLGGDIRAPIGVEWQVARRAGRVPVLFKQERLHTPAADAFIRELSQVAPWRAYHDARDLSRQVSVLLVDYLLTHEAEFALSLPEVEQLRAWQKEARPLTASASDEPRVVGAGGVVLSRERYVPSGGVVVEAA